MALTATATKCVKMDIIRILGMKNPIAVTASPSRSNIKYAVKSFQNFSEAFGGLLEGLRAKREAFPMTILYCRRLIDCGELYLHFRDNLGANFTEPVNAPDLPQFRLVDMYHSSTEDDVKDSIVASFSHESHLRLVIATVAFGMGVDCSHVQQIIHVGPPDDLEAYIQETGRAGRDGCNSIAVIFLIKGMLRQSVDKNMKNYITNSSSCRRDSLFSAFEGFVSTVFPIPCTCCDVCAHNCHCLSCEKHESYFVF